MRDWLRTARGCTCDTLDVCGLFELGGSPAATGEALPMAHDRGCAAGPSPAGQAR